MKKTIIILAIGLVALMAFSQFVLRIPLWQLGAAVEVATGLGAKLACSGRFISGFEVNQVMDDLATYSPATRLLEFDVDEENKQVTANLFGMNATTASFRSGIGCTLDIGDTTPLDNVELAPRDLSTANEPWPRGNHVNTLDASMQKQVAALLEKDNLAGLETRALVVAHNGKIVAEAYAPGYTSQTAFLGWSMAKSVTSMLVGHLIYKGMLDSSENELFTQWQSDDRADITVSHLLTMTSGLGFDETYMPGSDSTKMLFASHSASDVALDSSLAYSPGQHFSYSSGTTNILARLVFERLGGSAEQSLSFFEKAFVVPLGLNSLWFETDASGVFIGSSYLYATARDWAKLGQVLLNNGELNEYRLFDETFTRQLSTPNQSENDPRYGYQFWLNKGKDRLRWPNLPADAYAMRGSRSQIVMIIPSKNVVIVRLGWTTGRYSADERFSLLVDSTN